MIEKIWLFFDREYVLYIPEKYWLYNEFSIMQVIADIIKKWLNFVHYK